MEPIIVERIFSKPISQVWKAITDKTEMKQWYFDLAEFKPEVGFKFEFMGGTEENQYLHICEVSEVVHERKITYSWRYDGYKGISFVTFELFPVGKDTRLKLSHHGLETFPEKEDFARSNFKQGWDYFVNTALKVYLEG